MPLLIDGHTTTLTIVLQHRFYILLVLHGNHIALQRTVLSMEHDRQTDGQKLDRQVAHV